MLNSRGPQVLNARLPLRPNSPRPFWKKIQKKAQIPTGAQIPEEEKRAEAKAQTQIFPVASLFSQGSSSMKVRTVMAL